MAVAVPKPSDLFSDASGPAAVVDRFEAYKSALSESHQKAANGGTTFVPQEGIVRTGTADAIDGHLENITKGLSGDALAGIQDSLAAIRGVTADLGKDWTLTSPNSTGLVPYDLEAPAKLLVPRLTPLRNIIPRTKGIGSSRQFKRILGWSNSGTGGVSDQSAFMNSDSIQTSFGSLALRRGAKISYASDTQTAAYMEQGLSDQVNWKAQFAGQGFEDIRSLSQTALLWATMGAEERAMVYGRGTSGNGYSGTVAAPVASGVAANTGGTIAAGTYTCVITAKTGFGETAVSNTVSLTTTGTGAFTFTVTTEPVGSLGVYNLYVSQAAGAVGTATFQTSFVGNTYVLTTPPTSTGAVNAGATNTSADAGAYDGFLSVQSGPNSGYFNRVNAKLSTSNPGDEWQQAFASLYQSVKADPDHLWAAAGVVKELGDLLKTASSSNYRLQLDGDGNTGHFLGSVVAGVENQITRKMLDLEVHPWFPAGTSLIQSTSLPVPDSEISNTVEIVNVQDYMAIDWPVVQASYDSSTYLYGAMVHYAPAWSGLLTNIL